ncbi:hypothetical protein KEJ27_07325 [Candidatus Bathyarchaeota archaeon]|nr:hypothetical protein [Candidatus Bathyarchaeota archaeon]MBS7613514.1 hypothetical protein [Candidatus Bathyarchaeota archaeon]MBS7617266.1 hypothetical protein [Candidatus Bathyarchaeota archaeon]
MCEKVLRDLAIREWGKKAPSFEQFEEAVKQVESAFISRFRELHDQRLDLSFSIVLTSVDQSGKASIYLFDERGLVSFMIMDAENIDV